ncbi:hypothetical protein MMC13_000319 [Lambiella insularis]|nr:hypothetical protein [Lambiella insularis]
MAGTRSSTRQASVNGSSPPSSQSNATSTPGRAGSKRKSEASPGSNAKRGKKQAEKKQMTIEDTMPDKDEEDAMEDVKTTEAKSSEPKEGPGMDEGGIDELDPKGGTDTTRAEETNIEKATAEQNVEPSREQAHGEKAKEKDDKAAVNGKTSKMDDTGKIESKDTDVDKETGVKATDDNAVEESSQREASTPSSILEKGIIYFFFKGRVGIDDPSNVDELARSFIVLRPMPHGAKLGDGPIGDAGNNRLLALPKKVLPVSPRDRFMVFVEAANSSIEDIKKNHLTSSDYATKTAGTRHTPSATPVAEGVYAITTTGRETHLAYILTIPSKLSEVQRDVGLSERGSFVTSVKNPQYAGPANTNLPEGPGYPQDLLDEFRSLRWMPLQPKFLNYENCQVLLIGSGTEDLSKATDQQEGDEKANKDTALEEIEKLEHEDEVRVEHLKGNDSVFEDLDLSSKEYSKIPTTW